jgi:hypothetical protein
MGWPSEASQEHPTFQPGNIYALEITIPGGRYIRVSRAENCKTTQRTYMLGRVTGVAWSI